MMQQPSMTSLTPAGGFLSALTSTTSFLERFLSDSSAASSAGSALSRSACASSAMAFASAAFSLASFSCTSTTAFVLSASSVSRVMTTIISSTSLAVFCKTGCSSTSSCSITATSFAVVLSLSRPTWRRCRIVSISSRFSPRSRMKVWSSSRYDVGVTWLYLRSSSKKSFDLSSTLWWIATHELTTEETSSALCPSPMLRSAKKVFATLLSASIGHSENQSIVQQLTSDGNMRSRCRKASPIGENARTMWRLARTRPMKKELMAFLVTGKPCCCMSGRHAFAIVSVSSVFHRFGTSPALRMLLISSRNASCTICVSVKRNVVSLPSAPAIKSTLFKSSRHSFFPYPFATSIWNSSYSSRCVASLVSDWRPEPPTPSSKAFPSGSRMTRQMRETCSIASRNITSFIGALLIEL
mmetsp:Transcript_23989/g.77973  ORF Transcript_23989/g.77973 Transcript_23989/m.77973 type:complete len:412 (-) Transcript_23989:1910-3145(-)